MTADKPPLRLEHELIAEQMKAGGAPYVASLIVKGTITAAEGIPFWAATRAVEVALGLAKRPPVQPPTRSREPRTQIVALVVGCFGIIVGFILAAAIT